MNSSTTILLREWRRLAEQEATTIASREWTELNELLDQKDRIKDLLEDYEGPDFRKAIINSSRKSSASPAKTNSNCSWPWPPCKARSRPKTARSTPCARSTKPTVNRDGPSFWHSYS